METKRKRENYWKDRALIAENYIYAIGTPYELDPFQEKAREKWIQIKDELHIDSGEGECFDGNIPPDQIK